MSPALVQTDTILVSKWIGKVKKDDIILLQNPQEKEKIHFIIKRVKDIKNNKIYVEGDNKNKSRDSRHFGWIDKSCIYGKMITRF